MDHASLLKQFEHLDPHNQNTFEAKDLELLISTVQNFSSEELRSAISTLHFEVFRGFQLDKSLCCLLLV